MLSKIAVGNVKKSFRDFTIYFLTISFAVCIFYMFNSLGAQQELMAVTEAKHKTMEALSVMIGYISIFVSGILGFLIVYANNFLVKRRKKELGIYMTLGMEKLRISMILMLETLVIGAAALIFGIIAGVFLSQIMSIFTAKMFEADMTAFRFIISFNAIGKTVLYFGVIFSVVMLFNFNTITKCKLIDLLYAENRNEVLKTKNISVSVLLFMLSIASIGIAYYLILTNGIISINIYFTLSIVLGSIGTLLFFMSLSGFMLRFVQANKKLYFRNLNMFVLRQINSKINTTYVSMSVICIALLLTIGALSSGTSLGNALSQDLKEKTPFDNSFLHYYEEGDTEKDIYSDIDGRYPLDGMVKSHGQYTVYRVDETYGSILPLEDAGKTYEFMKDSKLQIMGVGDYNKIASMQGKTPIELSTDEYAIISWNEEIDSLYGELLQNGRSIVVSGTELSPGIDAVLDTSIDNRIIMAGWGIAVVSNELTNGMNRSYTALNINYQEHVSAEEFDREIDKRFYGEEYYENQSFNVNYSKTKIYLDSVSSKAIVTFISIYLGLVFLVACVAILALQQLSEAADNKKRYDLLEKIGADKDMVNGALFMQILVYFLMPLGLAVVHSIVGLAAVNDVIKVFGKVDLWSSILVTTGFFVVIYGGYFAATYIGCKNIIIK
jgi:putative ABC transport system permease protein